MSRCEEFPVYSGQPSHSMKDCDKCIIEEQRSGHHITDCIHVPVFAGALEHPIENCMKCSMPIDSRAHDTNQCEKHLVYSGPSMHEINSCTTCSIGAGANGHRMSLCPKHAVYAGPLRHSVDVDAQGLVQAPPSRHPVTTCESLPVYGGPRLHKLELCTRCPVDVLMGRHPVSKCPKFPIVLAMPEHNINDCGQCGTTADLRRHTIQECDSTIYPGPGNGHSLLDDSTNPAFDTVTEHALQEDPVDSIYEPPKEHSLSNDSVQTVHETVSHDIGACETCETGDTSSPHLLSECPKRQSKFSVTAPMPIHEQQMGRTFSHWESSMHRRHTDSSRTEQFFDADSDKADTVKEWLSTDVDQPKGPNRSQSLGSMLDYTRATQWIRGLLSYPEPYTSKLTKHPSASSQPRLDTTEGKPNKTDFEQNERARSSTAKSSQPSLLGSKVDSFQFKRAVSDLERLLNEAVTLAAGVAGSTDNEVRQPYKQPSISLHSHCHSLSPAEDSTSSGGTTVPSEGVGRTVRAPMKHASTFPGPEERPRLQHMVKNYSGSRDCAGEPSKAAVQPRESPHIEPGIPDRQSSKRIVRKVKPHVSALPTFQVSEVGASSALVPDGKQVAKGSEDIVDFQDYFTHHGDLATVHQPATDNVQMQHRVEVHERAAEDAPAQPMHGEHGISLRHRSHISLPGTQGFSLAKSHRRQPIARDWSPLRKRFVATVACLSTALIGAVLGIYAGIVPSIQYYIIDDPRVVVHGNTGCFLGLAIPTFLCWPLPLLHGRKPYILGSMVLAMPLLFPQAIAVSTQRLEHTGPWRAMLLASRALIGASLGFASMNFHSILTDLFGASLMSTNPHQEVADICDARRHGGGMGVWLGIWTWCWIGSLGIGFLIGAILIDHYPPVWGFYVSIMLVAAVLFLNVISPEVRRSAFRRSIAEVRSGEDISRRLARGEVMMHRVKTGPKWWAEEMYHGVLLCGEMLRQPGFFVVAIYSGWIYAQVVLLILLLGSLASNLYRFYATGVGLLVACLSLGALLAVPFQKANLFSRSRQAQLDTNRATLENKVAWTSHLVRRVVFTTMLPICGVCYACLSYGPPLTIAAPTIFATLVGFLSCLAISECNGLMMETFDTSDLSPGMTGRPKGSERRHAKRTNYSAFPRVTAGFALIHTFAFVLAAGATALAGSITRSLGQQVASGVVAGILFLFTIVLLLGLARFKEVQIVPGSKAKDMDRLSEVRRKSTLRRASMPNDPEAVMEEENAWRPVMIGNPISKMRRMNVFELGSMTRWQEIRKKNRLIDEGSHVNRAALGDGLDALDDQFADLRNGAQDLLRIGSTRSKGSRRLRRSDRSSNRSQHSVEMDDLRFKPTEEGATKSSVPGQATLGRQVLAEETEEEMNAVRRRSIVQGKQPAV